MGFVENLKNLDDASKLLSAALAVVIVYALASYAVNSYLSPQQQNFGPMHMRNFYQQDSSSLANTVSLLFAAGAGLAMLYYILMRKKPERREGETERREFEEQERKHPQRSRISKSDELKILSKALSKDEKSIMEQIARAKEITQDSLRFRLGWSKAKVSAILTNLDRLNLIQRERQGKSYLVRLTGGKR